MSKGNLLFNLLLLCSSTLLEGTANLTVVIDGYTVNSTLTSPATLPLGRTALLVCRVSGIPHEQQTSYQWTCPNQPCLQTGYAGIKINNNIIAINTTSTSDGGTYTCTVTAGGMEGRQDFRISVTGGAVAHSYGRLMIAYEALITDRRQLQPPNDDTGDGRIECAISGGRSRFSFSQYRVDSGNTQKATAVIPREDFTNFNNIEGSCGNVYLYLFLKKTDEFPQISNLTLITASTQSIRATMEFPYDSTNGIVRVITGYHRLDLGREMEGQSHNNVRTRTVTFSALVPGARYRITAWGLGGGGNRKRGSAPAVLEVTTQPSVPSPPRAFTITIIFEDGIELNWLPPRETNGDIQHYIIRYTLQNGTAQEINTTENTNYCNLTELEKGQTYYNFTVEAVNLAHTSAQSNSIGSYTHIPGSLNTPTIKSVTCPADIPSLPAHTKPLSAFTSPPPTGTRIRIGCEEGYFSEDEQTLECGPQGQWIGDVQQCTETCSSQNLTALFGELSYELPVLIRPGAAVSPQCREGYQVAVSAVCHEDTTWRLQGQCVQGTTEAIVIGATTANLLILLLSITLLVISGVLIVKSRKRHTSTLHSTSQVTFDKESKDPAVQIYDEIDDSHSAKTTTKHTAGVYQDLNINNMDANNHNDYAPMRM